MKGYIILLLSFMFHSWAFSQNYVRNPGFEVADSIFCSTGHNQFDTNNVDYWSEANTSSSDMYSTGISTNCMTYASNFHIPPTEHPRSGSNAAGFISYTHHNNNPVWNYREYIQNHLSNPLTPGKKYRASFYLSHKENSICSNKFGIYFSTSPVYYNTQFELPVIPQIEFTQMVTNDTGWIQLDTIFTATAAWEFITIGNFQTAANTGAILASNPNVVSGYYFIDDVSITPFTNIIGDTIICEGDTVKLKQEGDSICDWAKASSPGQIIKTDSILYVSPQFSTTYYAYGTFDTASIHITVIPKIIDFLGNDTTVCKLNPFILDATMPNASYLWSSGDTLPVLQTLSSGLYWVDVFQYGCIHSDSIHINLTDLPQINLGNDTSICLGDSIVLSAHSPDTNCTYLWNTGSTDSSIVISQQGTYYLEAFNGCVRQDTIQIGAMEPPVLHLGNDTTLCVNDQIRLEAKGNFQTLIWMDGSTSCVYNIDHEGYYWAIAGNQCGTISDSIFISLLDCDCHFIIPNAFTPNGDGINDEFIAATQCEFTYYSFLIFNRWGELIFQTTDPFDGWNGKVKGKKAIDGIYTYKVIYNGKYSDPVTKIGAVVLLR